MVLGAILLIAGIAMAVIIPRVLKGWERLIKPSLDMLAGLDIPEFPTVKTIISIIVAFLSMALETMLYRSVRFIGLLGRSRA